MASLVLVTGCGGPAPDSADQAGAGTDTVEPAGTAAPEEDAEGAEGVAEGQDETPEEPAALDEEQKMQLLLSTEDLPARPEGHSTHSGVSYFQESIAVEYTQYQDTFGQTECAQAMDQINVNLVGEDPLGGLAHAYRLPAVEREGQEYSPQVYAWVLSYGQEVDTSGIWEVIHEHCSGTQLQAGDEYVEIEPLDLEDDHRLDLEGISMVIHSGDEPTGAAAAVRHSMSVDFGENLVMLSAVGLDTEGFGELAGAQAHKLAQFQDSLAEDAG
ncbi:hypothetical protein [Nesterenkonia muleiensis]|uniref:hypothetical protein n=1 Tax=Nesterenkonia muleiensis TaxID=2282648 RepID=UPI000E70E71E|nr:hypothetical protein [Nesterenkonia muleiensis]